MRKCGMENGSKKARNGGREGGRKEGLVAERE